MKIKASEVPLYRGKLVIMIAESANSIKKYIPDWSDMEIYASTYYAPYKKKQGYYIILNFKSPYRKIQHGTITHEAVHAAHFIMKHKGMMGDFVNDESEAYLVEWIVDEVYKFIKKTKNIVG
jgi:hypothetical protein